MITFECGVKELKTVLNKAESLLSRRSKIETLRNMLIEVNDNGVYVKTTDLGNFATFRIQTFHAGSGKFVVDGKQFIQIIKSLKDSVKVEYDNILKISDTTGQTFQVKTYPLDTYYDKFPVITPSLTYSINANILAKAIDKVSYAINKDKDNERRTSFNYLIINGLDNKTDFVATDGYRLALYSPSSVYFSGRVKIHRDAVKILNIFLKGVKSDDVKIGADGECICFKTDNWEFITIDTCLTYPDYQYLISSYDNMKFNEFYIDKELYISNLKYLKTFIKKGEVFAIKLSITSDKAVFQIDKCREGEVKVELPIKDFKNDNSMIIGINGDFLLESLGRFDSNLVKVKVIDNESPVFLESVDEKDPYMCLIATYKLN
jgi:DNA polymerase III sliding clamp (beta) subunit (PCNA family)